MIINERLKIEVEEMKEDFGSVEDFKGLLKNGATIEELVNSVDTLEEAFRIYISYVREGLNIKKEESNGKTKTF